MIDIETALWRVFFAYSGTLGILQKASGAIRYVNRSCLPDINTLAAISENCFNFLAREAFHNAASK